MAKDRHTSRSSRRSGQKQAASFDATHFGPLAQNEGREDAQPSMLLASNGDVQRVGRYEVQGTLGRGGMGVVYEVYDPASNTILALKTIETRFLELSDSAAEHRFEHEIKVLQRLEHAGIVRLYETGIVRHPLGYDLAYYVMEKLDGETLVKDIKSNKRFPVEEAIRISAALCEALDYLNQNGVLHRDIKPGNIFLEKSGRVVLLDFGLARSEEFTRLTLAGQIVGTFSYMSPERLCGMPVNIAGDVFAVGVVLFQMLAGRHPFGSGTPTDLMGAIQRGIEWPDSILELDRGKDVQALLASMLAMDAEQRPSPLEVARRGRAILKRQTPVPAATSVQRRPSPNPQPTQTFQRTEVPISRSPTPTHSQPRVISAPPPSMTPYPPAPLPPLNIGQKVTSHPPQPSPVQRPPISHFDTSGGEFAPSQHASFIPEAPRPGPTWTVVALMCGSLTCLAFTMGLLVGSSRTEKQPRVAVAAPVVEQPAVRADPPPPQQEIIAVAAEPPPSPDPSSFNDFSASYAAAKQQIANGQHENAIKLLQRTLELNPAFADAHRKLGDAHRAIDKIDRASHHYKLYLALRPEASDAEAVQRILRMLNE